MVTGAIAYDTLAKDDPAAAKALADILRQSGLFTSKIADVPAENQDRILFMYAAAWPDEIRNNQTYSHPTWHYFDQPFVPAGDDTKPVPPADDNAVTELQANLTILKAPGEARARAIALAWVIHLSGDLHQPLHVVSEYSKTFPQGDRGGNSQYIRAEATGGVINLHSLWDGLILGADNDRDAGHIATELDHHADFAPEKLPETKDLDPSHWAADSFKLAVKDAYLDGTLKSSTDRHTGPILPAGYLVNAKAIAERQVTLAGYRIAAELKTADIK